MSANEFIGMLVASIVLLGSLFFMFYKPLKENTKTMTELTCAMNTQCEKLNDVKTENKAEHEKIWNHEYIQDNEIKDHEKRIWNLEDRRKSL